MSYDTTDLNIVKELRKNGRATNQYIADQLGLTRTTVSSRIKRMEDENLLEIVVVSDFSAFGYDFLMEVNVKVDGRAASDVAHELAAFENAFAVHVVTGRDDISMLVALNDLQDLSSLLLDKFSQVQGIRSMTPSIVVDIIKYEFDVAPLTGTT